MKVLDQVQNFPHQKIIVQNFPHEKNLYNFHYKTKKCLLIINLDI